MASLSIVVNLGTRISVLDDTISNEAEASGLDVPIPT